MNRIKIEFPEGTPAFTTQLDIRVNNLNYGAHLGNDQVLTLAHEVRIRHLLSLGFTELNVAGAGLIMADAAVQYKSEAFLGELLKAEVFVAHFTRCGCTWYYRFSVGDRLVALVQTGLVFFDYTHRKVVAVPEAFKAHFS